MEPTPDQIAARRRLGRLVLLTQWFIFVSSIAIFVGLWMADDFLAGLIAGLIYGAVLVIVGCLIMMWSGGVNAIRWWRESLARR